MIIFSQMSDNLKHKAAHGTAWSMLDRFGQQLVYLVTGVILVRTLAVEDFTLISMLSLLVALSAIFIDSGFSDALRVDYCTAAYFSD